MADALRLMPNTARRAVPSVLHILVVEDDRAIAALIADALEDEIGAHATVLHDGAEAIAYLADHSVHLAIFDYQLPGATGLAIYDAMATHVHTRQTPVLFVTANSERAEFRERGVRCVCKPFDLSDLFAAVKTSLRQPALHAMTR